MRRLTITLLTLLMSMGVMAESVYFECGKPLNGCPIPKCSTGSGLLIELDMEAKTYQNHLNPLEKLKQDAEFRLHIDSFLEGGLFHETAFELDTDTGYLKILEHRILFGVEASDGSGFIDIASINRVDLTYIQDLAQTKHQCKFINESEYDSTIKNWQKKLDKDKEEFEARRKF